MVAIITGDIIRSRRKPSATWLRGLKKILSRHGKTTAAWEIFRGDEFQLEIKSAEDAFVAALQIKVFLKTMKLDARMAIGLGDKTHAAKKISESNGSAFIRSGELFETLKKQKLTLAVNSGDADFDTDINLMIRLGLTFMNSWLPQPAEFVLMALDNPSLSQEELGKKLGINQAAVSRRQKRAHYDLVRDLNAHYRDRTKSLQP